ncbi:MAG: phosphate ABC transporter substrate-binding protein PstS [Sulfuricaulis sp.]
MLGVAMLAATTIADMDVAVAGDIITGAGSTAVYPVLSQWAVTYEKQRGVSINYQSIGSGGGIKQIKARTVVFGDSDMPLTPAELKSSNLMQFPVVIIGIAPIVNVPGVKPGQMVLSGKVLADIYLGKVAKWNDPEIGELNRNLKLPDMDITVVHRADGSGTTFYFTDYLSKVSPEWKQKVGSSTAVDWPVGVGGKGSEGVAAFVQRTPGSIGYDEYAYAMQTHLIWTRMINRAGKTVAPTMKTFQAASANADFSKVDDFYLIMTDQPGAASWPITGTTYFLLRTDVAKADNAKVVRFARWFLNHGQGAAQRLDYVPLPHATIKLIEQYWHKHLGA